MKNKTDILQGIKNDGLDVNEGLIPLSFILSASEEKMLKKYMKKYSCKDLTSAVRLILKQSMEHMPNSSTK